MPRKRIVVSYEKGSDNQKKIYLALFNLYLEQFPDEIEVLKPEIRL